MRGKSSVLVTYVRTKENQRTKENMLFKSWKSTLYVEGTFLKYYFRFGSSRRFVLDPSDVSLKDLTSQRAKFNPAVNVCILGKREGSQMFIIVFLSIFCQLLSPRF